MNWLANFWDYDPIKVDHGYILYINIYKKYFHDHIFKLKIIWNFNNLYLQKQYSIQVAPNLAYISRHLLHICYYLYKFLGFRLYH